MRTNSNHANASKFLSLVLRHKPQVIGIKLDRNGWCNVEELLKAMNNHGKGMTMEELEAIVDSDEKGRYSFSEDKKKIRANQGHSLRVDLQLKEIEPPEYLYHGTVERFLGSIFEKGLEKRQRQHVHLSEDIETANKVGSRRGDAVILVVSSGEMYRDGLKFYKSDNGVWLCDHVPSKYIKR